MPASDAERREVLRGFLALEFMPDDLGEIVWQDGTRITAAEMREMLALIWYGRELQRSRAPLRRKAQRRGMALLRAFLTSEQLRTHNAGGEFRVTGSAGGVYRLHPGTGSVWLVEKHGRRWYGIRRFCLHEESGKLPPADRSLAHLLLLATDEPTFLAEANATDWHLQCWDGEYLRRMRRRRTGTDRSLNNSVKHLGAPDR